MLFWIIEEERLLKELDAVFVCVIILFVFKHKNDNNSIRDDYMSEHIRFLYCSHFYMICEIWDFVTKILYFPRMFNFTLCSEYAALLKCHIGQLRVQKTTT